ncbi:hypothetical protein I4U23_006769 [Adineta vaga]|nr:hypothetical protein I4U23_006769 [Adineta vaga]
MQSIKISSSFSSFYSTCENRHSYFNRNRNEINEDRNFLSRSIQSSINLRTTDFYAAFIQEKNSQTNLHANRIESALLTSDYSHLLTHSIIHVSQPIITDTNMNRTNDLIKRIGAGDEILPKQLSTITILDEDNIQRQYLTLEQF